MKKMKNKIALFLSIVMCLSLCSVSVFAAKPKLTTKKVNLNIGTSKTVALKKAKKKVKWKVTKGKKNVKIKAIGRNKVKIIGKKVGKATIKATYGKKKYFINVNVKKNRNKIVKPTTEVEPTTKNNDGNVVINPEESAKPSEIEVPTTKNTEITTNENETTTKTVEETTTKRKPIYEEY